jgi:hypothetical protein
MRAQLVPLDGSLPIDITRDITIVGRREESDFRIDHKSVSKMHCIIVKTDGLLFLRDLGSTNGTRVNDQRVRRAALLPNDQLTIAHFKYRVSVGTGDAPAQVPHEYTQHLDADEVAELMRRVKQPEDDSDEIPMPDMPEMRPNPLPDVYPDDPGKKKSPDDKKKTDERRNK